MRFMFVGDSMTVGRTRDLTWRHWMGRHLLHCRRCVAGGAGHAEVVGPWTGQYEEPGSRRAGARCGDSPHLAAWGEGWLHMAGRVRAAVRDHGPDVLLVSLGLIDLGFYTDSAQTIGNVRRFVDEARAADARIRAVVLPVVPNVRARTDVLFAAEVERFNGLLAATLGELTMPGSPLLLAAPPTAPPVSYDIGRDTYDGTHPSPSGERKLAAAFAHTLHGARPRATAAPAGLPAGADSA
ncbi:GDSL-type esterase/lipase family protein [Streptomyces sp. NRRL F-5126]|uniref:GDSL-type esterase/lipase family protein n=1 Tax=Streptomyces sp. NRRL F-5126 TaxID=1463857 RepID=UPI0004CA5678|nr:GDSL-type esterase/lipase family protein [Streptomyces sp. NRRL F-5126]